jgi:hypothetical protein
MGLIWGTATRQWKVQVNNKQFWEELIRLLSYISNLFEALEPDLMEISLRELTLTSINSI